MMMRLLLNILITVIFIAAITAASSIIMAETRSNAGMRLMEQGRFEEAVKSFEDAIRSNPINAKYHYELGRVLRLSAVLRKKDTVLMRQAGESFKRALELCPRSADYAVAAGQTELDIDMRNLSSAYRYFEMAVSNDPNGFNTLYQTAYALLTAWEDLPSRARPEVIERLKRCLEMRPDYHPYIYPRLWLTTKDFTALLYVTPRTSESRGYLYEFLKQNELWQFRKAVPDVYAKDMNAEKERIRRIKEDRARAQTTPSIVAKSDWKGASFDGKNEFKDGMMYWSGTMDALINPPEGSALIAITARGRAAYGVYPYMIVELDGKEIGARFVDSEEWEEYVFPLETKGSVKVLSITFINDTSDEKKGIDRNLFIAGAEARPR